MCLPDLHSAIQHALVVILMHHVRYGMQTEDVLCREYSKQLNESRLKVLQARENAVHELIHDAHQSLTGFAKDQQKYKTLLTDLLVQVIL